jgi:heme/copper-type cytochrome/quinol oxidase subunit 2
MQAAKCAIAVGETVRAIVARTMAVIAVLTAFAGGAAMAQSAAQPAVQNSAQINAADTAWMMAATALVLMMTIPGLALFYAGMVRKKNVLATMAQSLAATALCSILWAAPFATFILLKVVGAFIPLRVDKQSEIEGLDVTQHGEALQ